MSENFVEYGWDDEIENEGGRPVLLPEGDYDFTVARFERARHNGSEKVPPCNMAKVTFIIWGAEDKIEITENFFLCNKFEWKLSALFLAIGMKKHGEKLRMNWAAVPGAKGKCHVYIDNYKKKDGSDGQSNKIRKFYAYDEDVETVSAPAVYGQPQGGGYQSAAASQPTYQPNAPQTGGWKAGSF